MNIKSILSAFLPSPKQHFKILDTLVGNLPPTTLKQIQSREIDGIVIRNFLSTAECKCLVENLRKQNENMDSELYPIFPSSFAQIDRNSKEFLTEMKDYFRASKTFNDTFHSKYGVDLLGKKLPDIFKKLQSNVNAVRGFDNEGIYVPGTFRIQHPEKVNINLHCGNQFFKMFPKYYEHLSSEVNIMDQLSYFIMLQEPDHGGRLILYDISWNEAQECDTVDNSITTLDGKTIFLDTSNKIKSRKLNIEIGDLLIFSGGQIWHAVEQVRGRTNRITFGGFLGFGKNKSNSKEYWWS